MTHHNHRLPYDYYHQVQIHMSRTPNDTTDKSTQFMPQLFLSIYGMGESVNTGIHLINNIFSAQFEPHGKFVCCNYVITSRAMCKILLLSLNERLDEKWKNANAKWNFHPIWIMMKNSLVKQSPDMIPSQSWHDYNVYPKLATRYCWYIDVSVPKTQHLKKNSTQFLHQIIECLQFISGLPRHFVVIRT